MRPPKLCLMKSIPKFMLKYSCLKKTQIPRVFLFSCFFFFYFVFLCAENVFCISHHYGRCSSVAPVCHIICLSNQNLAFTQMKDTANRNGWSALAHLPSVDTTFRFTETCLTRSGFLFKKVRKYI